MKDIKTLFLSAKRTGRDSDITSYREAVQELLETSPHDYLMQLEYIITSDIGLHTLKEFVEQYGLPIAAYDDVMTCLEKCVKKCKDAEKDDTEYQESIAWLESFRQKYIKCFAMYEFYAPEDKSSYIKTYYGKNQGGMQHRKLLSGMIQKFGEAAVPDLIITANGISEKSVCTLLEFLLTCNVDNEPLFYEWVLESTKDHTNGAPVVEAVSKRCASYIVNEMRQRNRGIFRESVIMGDTEAKYEYSETELMAIQDLISFKEYCITWLDEFVSSVTQVTESAINETQRDIYSLYEEFDGIVEDVSDSVTPMLPKAEDLDASAMTEAPWVVNTRNKKTGTAPTYISRNHDMARYGEDDDVPQPRVTSDDSDSSTPEPTLDDYRRPSALQDDNASSGEDDDEKEDSSENKGSGVNNYYYYTYTNSLNKNSNSFNRDNSSHDDHSSHRMNKQIRDDHSTGKHVNSHNTTGSHNTTVPEEDEEEKNDFHALESHEPWSLNIFDDTPFVEGFFDGKNKATARIGKLPTPLKNAIRDANEDIISFIKDIAEYDDELRCDRSTRTKCKTYISKMKDKKFFNLVGTALVRKVGKGYKGEVIVIPDMTGRHHDNKIDGYEFDSNGNMTTKTKVVEESEEFIKLFNAILSKAYKQYMEKSNPDDDNKKLVLVGNDLGKSFKYVVFRLSDSYAEKLFNHIKDRKEHPLNEAVGDADDNKPVSDHPVKDVLTDIDRNLVKHQQGAKKKVQDLQNVGRAAMKPVNRTKDWVGNMVGKWKDADETNVKERLADPHARSNLFTAIKKAIVGGSLLKAGLLLNPVFLFLTVTRGIGKNKREFRLRNEMIGEIKTEIKITEEKIQDADRKGDTKAKYQLMRFKNELDKKLLRVGGTKGWSKII